MGVTSKLCSYVHRDIDNSVIKILEESVNLLVILLLDEEAWRIMYEANIILPIMGYLSYDDMTLTYLFYEGIKELCSYPEFRA